MSCPHRLVWNHAPSCAQVQVLPASPKTSRCIDARHSAVAPHRLWEYSIGPSHKAWMASCRRSSRPTPLGIKPEWIVGLVLFGDLKPPVMPGTPNRLLTKHKRRCLDRIFFYIKFLVLFHPPIYTTDTIHPYPGPSISFTTRTSFQDYQIQA
jgi:hypothetical protein